MQPLLSAFYAFWVFSQGEYFSAQRVIVCVIVNTLQDLKGPVSRPFQLAVGRDQGSYFMQLEHVFRGDEPRVIKCGIVNPSLHFRIQLLVHLRM